MFDEDPDKLNGWEGQIEAHPRHVRYPERKAKGKARAEKVIPQKMSGRKDISYLTEESFEYL